MTTDAKLREELVEAFKTRFDKIESPQGAEFEYLDLNPLEAADLVLAVLAKHNAAPVLAFSDVSLMKIVRAAYDGDTEQAKNYMAFLIDQLRRDGRMIAQIQAKHIENILNNVLQDKIYPAEGNARAAREEIKKIKEGKKC